VEIKSGASFAADRLAGLWRWQALPGMLA